MAMNFSGWVRLKFLTAEVLWNATASAVPLKA